MDGFFYQEELSKVSINSTTDKLKIDKILKSKGRGKNKHMYVSWKGLPADLTD